MRVLLISQYGISFNKFLKVKIALNLFTEVDLNGLIKSIYLSSRKKITFFVILKFFKIILYEVFRADFSNQFLFS